ncbi:MAG: cell division protein FtsA [Treponema sp.]|nr:cell division protein FtsA [Treponema sp.]
MADDRTIVGLDIGTSVIRAAIGEVDDEGILHIVATASRKSAGLRNGVIVNIEDAKDAIKETLTMAETKGGVLVNSVIASIGGSQIESQNSRGVVPIRNNSKGGSSAVTHEDIEKVIDIATAINYPADREKIHVIPQDYLVDGVGHISDPINRLGFKLESKVHIITASKTIIQNIKTCMDKAGYGLDGVMLKTLAETQAVCHDDELELGSIVIDLGAGTTDVIVLIDGAPVSTASVQVGGNLVTNDIAVVNSIPVAAAEKIKVEQGCCWANCIQDDEDVILPGVGGRAPELTSKSEICKIITARMAQIFTMVKQAIIKNTSDSIKQLSGNIILTGGGAQMQGAVELAQEIFKTSSVRRGVPESLGGLEEEYRKPEFATAIGLVVANKGLVTLRNSGRRSKRSSAVKSGEEKENIFKRLRKLFF